jgi:hypothetical protein
MAGASFVGIIYLRPGHISSAFVLGLIDALRASSVEVEPPFVAVAERQDCDTSLNVPRSLTGALEYSLARFSEDSRSIVGGDAAFQ